MLGFGFGIGGQILIARRNGNVALGEIGKITDNSLSFLMGMGLVLFLLIKFFSPAMLRPLIASRYSITRPVSIFCSTDFMEFSLLWVIFSSGRS